MAQLRGFRVAGKQRRTNWIGAVKVDSYETVAPGAVTWLDWFASHFGASGEAAGYVEPTLVRMRGHWSVDPVIGTGVGSSFGIAYCVIMVCNPAIVLVAPYASMSPEDDAWSSDHIVWVGAHTFGVTVAEATAVGRFAVPQDTGTYEIDVKAQRKLKDDQRVMVGFYNSDLSNVNVSNTADLRGLLKE